MPYRWSAVEDDLVWVVGYDDEVCDECGDGVANPIYSGDEAFCKPCYDNIFGED